MKRPRSGIIGAGFMATLHLIESDDVDLVHIGTPDDLHVSLGQQALAAGKHVICERPLATSVEAAEGLLDAAASAGVVATVPFIYRFYPAIRDARGRARREETGRLHLIHGSSLQDWLSICSDGLRAARLTAAVLRSAASGDWQVVG
jgi:predicted dehydrogenase